MVGKRLTHYEITGSLGAGGMGEVYRARDTKLDRDVALKVLPAETAADPIRLSRFAREAKAVASLNHPNIVTLYSVDESDGVHFLTMEVVEGRVLTDLLPSTGFSLEQLIDLGAGIADALAAAHAQGIIHRDLKPGNVMVTDEGNRIKVLDFGLAKLNAPETSEDSGELDTLTATRSGFILGTPHYMAPEQASSKEVDLRADIFALGVMLYEMATGERPFKGDSAIELLSSVLKDQPQPLAEIKRDLPPELQDIIDRCLAKTPADRYESAGDLASDLRSLGTASRDSELQSRASGTSLNGPVSHSPVGIPASPWWRQRPLTVGLAVVVLAIIALAVRFYNPGNPTHETGPAAPVVAVLPFENLGHASDEFFADGVTDEITSRLALIAGLEVISQTSARTYVGSNKSSREIGNDLGADYILEGTIRWDRAAQAEGRVLVSPRLVLVANDTYAWSDSYEREVTEIFALQAEIAARIAGALDVTILEATGEALNERPTQDIAAYQDYLQGMQQLFAPGFSRESFELGVRKFESAVARDEGFALAHAMLSAMNSRLYHYGYDRTPERLARALSSAERALALQPDLPQAHLALGYYYYWGVRDYNRALISLEEARRQAPNLDEALLATAYVKRRQGDFAASVRLFEKNRRLNPRDPVVFVALGETYGVLRRYDEARDAFKQARVLQPDDPYPHTELALLYLRWRGDTEAAREVLAQAPGLDHSENYRVRYLVDLFDQDYAAALELLDSCPFDALEAGAFYLPKDLLRGEVQLLRGQPDLARDAFEASLLHLQARHRDNPEDSRLHGAFGLTYAGLGRTEDAVTHGRRAVELSPLGKDALEAPVPIINLAMILTLVGDKAEALAQLDLLLSMPSIFSIAWLEEDPRWDGLRTEPGYEKLLEKYSMNAADR